MCLLAAVFSTAAPHLETKDASQSSHVKYIIVDKSSPTGDDASFIEINLDTTKDKPPTSANSSSRTIDRSAINSDMPLDVDTGTMKVRSMLNDCSPTVVGNIKWYTGDYDNLKVRLVETYLTFRKENFDL